jgi:hypothetical protein
MMRPRGFWIRASGVQAVVLGLYTITGTNATISSLMEAARLVTITSATYVWEATMMLELARPRAARAVGAALSRFLDAHVSRAPFPEAPIVGMDVVSWISEVPLLQCPFRRPLDCFTLSPAGCPPCPDCKPGRPCRHCSSGCPVCQPGRSFL